MKLKELLEITEFCTMTPVKAPEMRIFTADKDDEIDTFDADTLVCQIMYAIPAEMFLAPHLLAAEVKKIYLENGCVDICLGVEYGEDI
ncbi:MAG: hypothetical protein MJZ20_05640 [Bacteroidaceae bacterium]|nr:hypothetical protein [Bacteroidaceae bacterium]